MRLLSKRGARIPAPTSTSVPARLSCASAASIALLLPEHSSATSNGSSTMSCGIAGIWSSSGWTVRAPSRSHSSRRFVVRLAHHDVVDAERAQRGDRQEADRAAARHQPARAGSCTAGAGDAVQRDRHRFGQRGVLRREVLRDAQQLRRREWSCTARTRPASRLRRRRPGRGSRTATAGPRGSTRTCRTRTDGPAIDPLAHAPAGHLGTHGDDRAAVLVALDRARTCRPIRGGSAGRSRRCRSG